MQPPTAGSKGVYQGGPPVAFAVVYRAPYSLGNYNERRAFYSVPEGKEYGLLSTVPKPEPTTSYPNQGC